MQPMEACRRSTKRSEIWRSKSDYICEMHWENLRSVGTLHFLSVLWKFDQLDRRCMMRTPLSLCTIPRGNLCKTRIVSSSTCQQGTPCKSLDSRARLWRQRTSLPRTISIGKEREHNTAPLRSLSLASTTGVVKWKEQVSQMELESDIS